MLLDAACRGYDTIRRGDAETIQVIDRETGIAVGDRWCGDITGPWMFIDRETGHTVGDRWCSDITGPWGGS